VPITNSDVLLKYSATNGSAGNTQASSQAASLGKYISTTPVTNNSINNVFDNITGVQNAANQVDYRCIFVHNNNQGGITLLNAIAYISAEVSGGASSAIGVDPIGVTPIGQSSAQAQIVANNTSMPSGVTFTSPNTYTAGIALGNIPAGSCVALWIRRTANNTAAINNDGVVIVVQGDTTA
jgi:hypothetical protein